MPGDWGEGCGPRDGDIMVVQRRPQSQRSSLDSVRVALQLEYLFLTGLFSCQTCGWAPLRFGCNSRVHSNVGAQCNSHHNEDTWSFFLTHCAGLSSVTPRVMSIWHLRV